MWPGLIVAGDPRLHGVGSLVRGLVDAGVGPFSQAGLDEAFGFAVGAWRVGPGAGVLQLGPGDEVLKEVATIGIAIIGQMRLTVTPWAAKKTSARIRKAAASFLRSLGITSV